MYIIIYVPKVEEPDEVDEPVAVEEPEVVEATVRVVLEPVEVVSEEAVLVLAELEEAAVVEEEEASALNCSDWARIPLFWGSSERKLTW